MLTYIQPFDDVDSFPSLDRALAEPNGLIAMGGDLSSERLVSAYQKGIFPWYSAGEPILWWSPNPRMVMFPSEFRASRSLKKAIKKHNFEFSVNKAFHSVIKSCAEPRNDNSGTWITSEMQSSYMKLHEQGFAHSVEIWQQGQIAGGLYGIALGSMFFGESMFSRVSNASKAAYWALCHMLKSKDFRLVDCQVYSEHLATLGAREISRDVFENHLKRADVFQRAAIEAIEPSSLCNFLGLSQ